MPNEAKLFTVVCTDPETGAERIAGEVILDSEDKLSLYSEEAGYEKFLNGLIAEMNYKPVIGIKSPGVRPGSLAMTDFHRSKPGFHEAMLHHLRHFYGIELRSSQDFASRPGDFQDLGGF